MQALIGDFAQPLPDLSIHIVQIGELAQRPEVLPQVTDGAFDFPFFPSDGRIAGGRIEVVLPSEAEEARIKAHQPAVMFGYGGGQIIVGYLACDTTQFGERMTLPTGEGFE